MTEKIAWEAAHESFVTDRTTLDNLLYTMLHDVNAVDEALLSAVSVGISRYTHVFYCPVAAFCHIGDDTARVKSLAYAYQEVYDAALKGLLERYVYFDRCHTILSRSLTDRLARVVGALDRFEKDDAK